MKQNQKMKIENRPISIQELRSKLGSLELTTHPGIRVCEVETEVEAWTLAYDHATTIALCQHNNLSVCKQLTYKVTKTASNVVSLFIAFTDMMKRNSIYHYINHYVVTGDSNRPSVSEEESDNDC